ncbi:MAG: hypothetical protein KIT84_24720 [Labilithrix sp.]|nr:hypothetical protein [Labilithrix sp.]MCW5814254.1 hypothetical protein [Labilithrix sp.]
MLLPTTVVGSYVQPEWLVDRANLKSRLPPRVRAREVWKIPPAHLLEAQDAATPSKTFMIGVLDLGDANVETPEVVATRIRRALDVLPPERVIVAPDCGMKYLSRETAFGKLSAMVKGAAVVRREVVPS